MLGVEGRKVLLQTIGQLFPIVTENKFLVLN